MKLRNKVVAWFGALLMAVGIGITAAPSAQAWGEITYPGAGWALSSTTYRDSVYCLGSKNAYWLEVQIDSRRYFGANNRVVIDPYAIRVSRLFHNTLGEHQYYGWYINGIEPHSISVQQGMGGLPQTIVNGWYPGYLYNWSSYGNGNTAVFSAGLDWTAIYEDQNPHMYINMVGGYNTGNPYYRTSESYSCSVDLGPQQWP